MQEYKIGDTVICDNIEILPGNTVSPPLKKDEEYNVIGICNDSKNQQHLDVGLKSEYMQITSWNTGEALPKGDTIHWCHPSRFHLKG